MMGMDLNDRSQRYHNLSKIGRKTDQIITVPSGIRGFSKRFRVLGNFLGDVSSADASGVNCQWQVIEGASTDDLFVVDIKGGDIFTQGAFNTGNGIGIKVDDVLGLIAGIGFIIIHISRNSATRSIVSGVIEYIATEVLMPVSTETDQYIALAEIYADGEDKLIRQLQFSPLCIFEDMAIVNGELKLVSLSMSGMNYYDPP